jgi:hypothetical protein
MQQPTPGMREGFQLKKDKIASAEKGGELDAKTQRALTICNLFLNEKLSIADIVHRLDEDERSIVLALLEQGVIRDRRQRQGTAPQGVERRVTASLNS